MSRTVYTIDLRKVNLVNLVKQLVKNLLQDCACYATIIAIMFSP